MAARRPLVLGAALALVLALAGCSSDPAPGAVPVAGPEPDGPTTTASPTTAPSPSTSVAASAEPAPTAAQVQAALAAALSVTPTHVQAVRAGAEPQLVVTFDLRSTSTRRITSFQALVSLGATSADGTPRTRTVVLRCGQALLPAEEVVGRPLPTAAGWQLDDGQLDAVLSPAGCARGRWAVATDDPEQAGLWEAVHAGAGVRAQVAVAHVTFDGGELGTPIG